MNEALKFFFEIFTLQITRRKKYTNSRRRIKKKGRKIYTANTPRARKHEKYHAVRSVKFIEHESAEFLHRGIIISHSRESRNDFIPGTGACSSRHCLHPRGGTV